MLSQNIDIIKSKIEQDSISDQFLRAKKFLKATVRDSKGYSLTARKLFENVLARITDNDLHFWTDCLYGCAILTPLEESPTEKYYETLKEIMDTFGSPSIKEWTCLLALNIQFPGFNKFLHHCKNMQLPEDLKNLMNCVEKISKLAVAEEPYSSDFLSDVYLGFLDSVEKLDLKCLQKLIEYFQEPYTCKKLSRWLFTAVRVLKFIHKERKTEADSLYSVIPMQYFELISFEKEFIVDIPTDIDYKM